MHQKKFGGRGPPGPAARAYSAPPGLLAGFRGKAPGREENRGRKG